MKIILFSDSKAVFEITKKIAEGWFELIWCEYDVSQKEKYPSADIVIIHFDRARIKEGTFLPIVRIKSKMGEVCPILTILDGKPQEIFSVLKAGAYDYITTIKDTQKYKQKIKDIVLWNWYQKNMVSTQRL